MIAILVRHRSFKRVCPALTYNPAKYLVLYFASLGSSRSQKLESLAASQGCINCGGITHHHITRVTLEVMDATELAPCERGTASVHLCSFTRGLMTIPSFYISFRSEKL
jgi:hypothetical protein